MKKRILSTVIMIVLVITTNSNAQVGIGVETANINASAQLEVASTTKGFLPPRMTASQRDAISTPAAGLVLWCTNCGTSGELQVYNGTAWTNMIGGTASLLIPIVTPTEYKYYRVKGYECGNCGVPIGNFYCKSINPLTIGYFYNNPENRSYLFEILELLPQSPGNEYELTNEPEHADCTTTCN